MVKSLNGSFIFNFIADDGNSNSIPELAINSHSGAELTPALTDRKIILINHSSFAIKMSQPNINTPNSDLVSSLSQS